MDTVFACSLPTEEPSYSGRTPSRPLPAELRGTWRLLYTTAADVLVLLEAERATGGLLQIGDIFQTFGFDGDASAVQSVDNVIRLSLPVLLAPAPLNVASDGGYVAPLAK